MGDISIVCANCLYSDCIARLGNRYDGCFDRFLITRPVGSDILCLFGRDVRREVRTTLHRYVRPELIQSDEVGIYSG